MDIAEWLRGLGLAQYERAFHENAIDESVLPSLTADDLKDLGVTMVRHRRKLLDAIASLRAVDVPPAGTPPMALVGRGPLPTPPPAWGETTPAYLALSG
jgi:SAM domain (Sterile alpha motif)